MKWLLPLVAVAAMATGCGVLEEAQQSVANAIPENVVETMDVLVAQAGGLTGLGILPDAGLLGGALTALSWYLRDVRKRKGMDPLQRADKVTPSTNNGPTS